VPFGLRGENANPTNLIRVMPAEGDEMRHSETVLQQNVPQAAAALLGRLRARSPRVHCITNTVAQNFTANALLAAGCIPSMTLSPEEIGGFVAKSDALLVNLGTFDVERRAATEIAVAVAGEGGIPWVLDPVFVDRSPARAEFARGLMAQKPAALRLNHAEFATLSGAEVSAGALTDFARQNRTIVALSGKADLVSHGARVVTIENGHALMSRVTAMGCAGSGLLAVCLAVGDDAFTASAAALLMLGVAGEIAAEAAKGPGSFAAAILDALYALDAPTLIARARAA
jgi:hydroxyethylthiazole kinase